MPWFYDSDSGKLVHEDPPSPGYYVYEAALHTGTGWHELTVADSASQAQAAAAAAALKLGPVQGSSTSIAQLGQNEVSNLPAQVAGGAAASAIPGVAQIGSFFGALAEGNTWIRVAEGILGIILIAVGLARITHAVPIANKIAGAVT